MFELAKILVPVDFSARSRAAVSQACALARHFHSQLTLLHVNEVSVVHPRSGPFGFGISGREATLAEHVAARQRELNSFAAEELAGLDVRKIMCTGDPARVIMGRVETWRPDLVLMSTHGCGQHRRLLLGSVAAKVLHDAECPVWTTAHPVEQAAGDPTQARHVMCAVNFGPQCGKALHWAADFAAEIGARLTVVHAVLGTPPDLPERYMFQWHGESHYGAEERLRAFLRESNVRAETLVVEGEAPKAVSAAARQYEAGLLVMGRSSGHGKAGRLGSRAYGILCHAPCPVISI